MKWHRKGVSALAALVAIGIFALWLGRSVVKLENGNIEACLHLNQDQVTKLHLEGSQLVCGEDCHFVEPLNCIVKGWSQAGYEVGFTDLSLACDTFPGHQIARCRSCDDGAGILPRTCNLLYSFSKADESAAKEAASSSEKVVALFLMLLLGILVFMLLRELQRKQRIPKSIWKGRSGDGGNVEVENIKSKMRLEKGQLEREKGRLPESGGCCQEKSREMGLESGNSDGRTAPTFLLEHSMIKERKGRKKAGKYSVDRS